MEGGAGHPISGDARRATGGDDVSASDLRDQRAAGLPSYRDRPDKHALSERSSG